MRNPSYKPLLFTTTARNPERLKLFLNELSGYVGQVLNEEIIQSIALSLIKKGLYRPTTVTDSVKKKWREGIELTDQEAKLVYDQNPQKHKEAGYERGWPSRFATWYSLISELGFAWIKSGDIIELSDTGKLLLDIKNPQNETVVFANALSKHYRDNPFRRVSNSGNTLVLLLKTIQLLNNDSDYNSAGLSRREIPILICWRDNNAELLYRRIKDIRTKHGFNPSDEIILDECESLIDSTKRNPHSLLLDYPDDFLRKMRLTGLITVRGGGRFVDINKKEISAIEYLINKPTGSLSHKNERGYYDYISTIDEGLVSKLSVSTAPISATKEDIVKWATYYSWEVISEELLGLVSRTATKDNILKYIEAPLRLEFLTTLAIAKKLKETIVKPNYITDDEGLPTSFAPGGGADIECVELGDSVLVEVTLLRGVQQHIRESFSVRRHLDEFKVNHPRAYSVLITPGVHIDTLKYANYLMFDEKLEVRVIDIKDFVKNLDEYSSINKVTIGNQPPQDVAVL